MFYSILALNLSTNEQNLLLSNLTSILTSIMITIIVTVMFISDHDRIITREILVYPVGNHAWSSCMVPCMLSCTVLRCVEIGISIRDLDLLTIGMVLDIWTEKGNDGVKYDRVASQEDFDKF